jgi:tetratricopeptide (TPR) repeat protein
MKPILTYLLIFLLAKCIYAQHISLKGQVTIQNSLYKNGQLEFVKGAEIFASFASPTFTDDQGKFELVFATLPNNMGVKVYCFHPELEVVNSKELEHVLISQDRLLQVTLAKKGNLAVAQAEFYNISKAALYRERDSRIALLRGTIEQQQQVIAQLEADFGQKIADRFAAEEFLRAKVKDIESQLPNVAQEMAAKNLDFASEIFRQAYELFLSGKVSEAISILENNRLQMALESASATIKKGMDMMEVGKTLYHTGQKELEQILECFMVKAQWLELEFKFSSAAEVYEKALEVMESGEVDISSYSLGNAYSRMGKLHLSAGEYDQSLHYYRKCLANRILGPFSSDSLLAYTYNDIASIYAELGDFHQAIELQFKAIHHAEACKKKIPKMLTTLYNNLGATFLDAGNYPSAIQACTIAMRMSSMAKDENRELAMTYANLGVALNYIGNREAAIRALQFAIKLNEPLCELTPLEEAIIYNNLATISKESGDFQHALLIEEKVISLIKEVSLDHPFLGVAYCNLGIIHSKLENLQDCLLFQKQGIEILERNLAYDHPTLAVARSNYGTSLFQLGKTDSAVTIKSTALNDLRKVFPESHPAIKFIRKSIFEILFQTGLFYLNNHDYNTGLGYFQSATAFAHLNDSLYLYQGHCYYGLGFFTHAICSFQHANEMDLSGKFALEEIALTYCKLGNLELARHSLERLYYLDADHSPAHCGWLLYYALKGDFEKALLHFEKALERDDEKLTWIESEEALLPIRNTERYQQLKEKYKK